MILANDSYLSPAEFKDALDQLPEADLIRLYKIAARYIGGTGMQIDDLAHEAILRAMDGTRRCPRGLHVMTFLAKSMQSIAWAERERCDTNAAQNPQNPEDMPDKADTPELQVMGAEARQKRIDTLFGDDEEAMMVLMSRYDGYEPNEICKICEIDRTRYASVLRRIRRTMERQELEGGNDEQ